MFTNPFKLFKRRRASDGAIRYGGKITINDEDYWLTLFRARKLQGVKSPDFLVTVEPMKGNQHYA